MTRENPNEPYEFDESRPRQARIPRGCRRVIFGNPDNREVNSDGLQQAVLQQRNRGAVRCVEIDWNSHLIEPWLVPLFPNVSDVILRGSRVQTLEGLQDAAGLQRLGIDTYKSSRRSLAVLPELSLKDLWLRIAKRQDVEFVAQCRPRDYLGVAAWPLQDFTVLQSVRMRQVRLSSRSALSLRGLNCDPPLRLAHLHCGKLQTVGGTRIQCILLSGCNALDLNTLGEVGALEKIWFWRHGAIESFGFLRGCAEVRDLTIDTARVSANDWHHILEHPQLRKVVLSPVTDQVVQQLASEGRHLAVTNGRLYYFRGESVSWQDFCLLTQEMLGDADKEMPVEEDVI